MATPILGVGSNLDLTTLVSQLVAAERAPKDSQLSRLESATTSKVSALGQLRSSISEFQSALDTLNKLETFEKRSATSTDTKMFTATASTSAQSGIYKLQIEQLATANKVALRSVAGGSAATFNTGTLSIDLGTGSPVEVAITSENNTLAGIRDAINTAAKDLGVSANIITDASGSRLVLSSNQTGAGKDISVAVTDDGSGGSNALSLLAFDPLTLPVPDSQDDPRVLVAAQNAKFTVDGLAVESETNTASDVIDGVTITLVGAQSQEDRDNGKTIDLTIGEDKSGVKTAIKKFVDAYNKMISTANSLTSVTRVAEDKAPSTGALVGDASVRSLVSGVRGAMGTVMGEGNVRLLADLGITTQQNGTLSINDTTLDNMLSSNYDDVAQLLAGENGLMTRLDTVLDGFTQSGGILDSRIKNLQGTLSKVDKERTTLNDRMEQYQQQLVRQFSALDSLLSQLTSTSNALTNQLASLPGISSR